MATFRVAPGARRGQGPSGIWNTGLLLVILVIVTLLALVFVIVRVLGRETVPTVWFPKARPPAGLNAIGAPPAGVTVIDTGVPDTVRETLEHRA